MRGDDAHLVLDIERVEGLRGVSHHVEIRGAPHDDADLHPRRLTCRGFEVSLSVAMLPSLIAPVSSASAFGGAELAALALAEALAARGHRVRVFGLEGSLARGA